MGHRAEMLTAARAEALFTSDLSANSEPSAVQVAEAIRRAVRAYSGTRGCAAEVAAAYGEHPETAAPRMRWAREVVETIYSTPGEPNGCDATGKAPAETGSVLRRADHAPVGGPSR